MDPSLLKIRQKFEKECFFINCLLLKLQMRSLFCNNVDNTIVEEEEETKIQDDKYLIEQMLQLYFLIQ